MIILVLALIALVAFIFGYLISASAYESGTLQGMGAFLKAYGAP